MSTYYPPEVDGRQNASTASSKRYFEDMVDFAINFFCACVNNAYAVLHERLTPSTHTRLIRV